MQTRKVIKVTLKVVKVAIVAIWAAGQLGYSHRHKHLSGLHGTVQVREAIQCVEENALYMTGVRGQVGQTFRDQAAATQTTHVCNQCLKDSQENFLSLKDPVKCSCWWRENNTRVSSSVCIRRLKLV